MRYSVAQGMALSMCIFGVTCKINIADFCCQLVSA